MKHTKGPWYTSGAMINHADQHLVIDEKTGNNIAICYGVGSLGEAKANAHLITAAPELLEACHTILNRFGGHVRDYEEMTAGQKLAIERMVEAIRKAEGN